MKKLNIGSVKEYFSSKSSRIKVGIIGIIVLLLAIIIIPASFAQLTPVASVTVPSVTLSYANSDEGSWQFVKSAKWISRGKARITIELDTLVKPKNDYTDVILVLDTSGSMIEGRLSQVKSDVNELINDTIPKGNKIALITFNTTSEIITDFTDDSTLLQESVNNLTATGETNYYQGLVNVDTILKNYEKQDNRDCVVLFLTDGLPTVDTPNEVAQYKYLKSTYPYLTINGIQYEMGETPLTGIKNITDNQYIASVDTLSKFLYRAATSPASYTTFELTDYIYSDYFNVTDVSSITASTGTVSLEDEEGTSKVIWNLNGLTSGLEAELTIDINLNEDLIGVGGIYPTNERESVNYQIGSTSTTEISASTPILADNYLVTYEANAPDSCEVSNMPESKNASVFDTVKIDTDTKPVCEGYKFKEWQLVTDEATQVNTDYFIMPEANVTLRAVWSKLSLSKSMEGTISKVQSLYRMVADSSIGLDTSVSFSSTPTTSNSGVYTIESTTNDTYPVHYYRGILDNNNVLFANFCWKIVRTTETGGVKLIYNGEPNEDGQCLSDRSNHIGYGARTTQTLSSSYYYGTSYTYDTSTSTFSLAGDLTQATWNATTGPTLIGKFTCKNATADGTCPTLYQVASYNSASSAYVFPLNTTTNYTQIGVSKFNTSYTSPADVGYMYDTRYTYSSKSTSYSNVLRNDSTSSSSNYYYGNDIIINTDGTYTLQNKTLNDDGETYTITEAEQKMWSDNYSTLAGYYTCRTTSSTCSTVYYIAGTASNYQYNVALTSGATLDSQKIVVSATKTNNADGTYTLSEPLEVLKKDWFANYSKYKNYYVCNDLTSTTCSPMAQITSTSNYRATYLETIGFVYGNDVSWDGTNYTLVDTTKSNDGWSADYKTLATKHHYTCLDTDGVCTSVYYIHYFGSSSSIYYLTLKEGKDIEAAKTEMFTNDENSTSSDIKLQVDSWYAANMTDYTEKLEDTIWCNDRTFYSGTLKSKDTSSTSYSYFGAYGRVYNTYEPSVTCPEKARDGFTVLTETGGNGLLDYPVGLLTADEIRLAGGQSSNYYLKTGQYWWSLSPYYFNYSNASGFNVYSDGGLSNYRVDYSRGVRPSVSLAPGTKSIDGEGTPESPYIVE